MSVFTQTSARNKFSARLSQLSPTLFGQLGCLLGAFAAIVYLQMPQLAAVKERSKIVDKLVLRREEARTNRYLSIAKTFPTFGYDNLVANWYFLEFVQYFGDSEVRKQVGFGSSMEYFEAILNRDPRFLQGYFYLSSTGTMYAGAPERSVEIMERGLKSLSPQVPDRGYFIWRLKAVDELLFLGNVPAARNSMQTAANWARQSPTQEGQNVARLSQNTATYLARNPNSKKAQFDTWSMVLNAAVDDFVAQRAIAGIRATGGNVTISPTGEYKIVPPTKD